jgi:hypothetical protein
MGEILRRRLFREWSGKESNRTNPRFKKHRGGSKRGVITPHHGFRIVILCWALMSRNLLLPINR